MKNNVSREEISQARRMDLLTYLQQYEPGELIRISNGTYTTRTHDSLKISNGKWFWWSKSIGGHSALDYLVEVKGMGLVAAVRYINGLNGHMALPPEKKKPTTVQTAHKKLILPAPNDNNDRVKAYLQARGIDTALLDHCFANKLIYEDMDKHNCVFVGYDTNAIPSHATLRSSSIHSTFCRDAEGSDKRFSFRLMRDDSPDNLYIFESPIDLLSYFSLYKLKHQRLPSINALSLSGVYIPSHRKMPAAMERHLSDNPNLKNIIICFDNDTTGRRAADILARELHDKYNVAIHLPENFKDYNDMLMSELGITHKIATRVNGRKTQVVR